MPRACKQAMHSIRVVSQMLQKGGRKMEQGSKSFYNSLRPYKETNEWRNIPFNPIQLLFLHQNPVSFACVFLQKLGRKSVVIKLLLFQNIDLLNPVFSGWSDRTGSVPRIQSAKLYFYHSAKILTRRPNARAPNIIDILLPIIDGLLQIIDRLLPITRKYYFTFLLYIKQEDLFLL